MTGRSGSGTPLPDLRLLKARGCGGRAPRCLVFASVPNVFRAVMYLGLMTGDLPFDPADGDTASPEVATGLRAGGTHSSTPIRQLLGPTNVGRSARTWLDRVFLVVAVIAAGFFIATWAMFLTSGGVANIGVDYVLYRDAAVSWLGGGPFYLPHQVSGPYVIAHGDVLYPPPILILLIPFTILPAVLWWVVPIALTAFVVAGYRPQPWAWLTISLCLLYPISGVKILHGNPGLWFAAAIAAGTRLAWPSVLVFLKPTLLPFAFIGIKRRSWWLGLAGLAIVSLAFLPMWPDYVSALLNGRTEAGLLYSLHEVPLVAIPVIAWIGRRPDADHLARA